MKIKHIIIMSFLILKGSAYAQSVIIPELTEDAWEIQARNHEFKEYKGKRALYLDNGNAKLKNSIFTNGIVEYDINLGKERNFAGVHFRIHDRMNYEELYLRPHRSGDEDSMQYSPVINGSGGWQLYFGEGYWAQFEYSFDTWMHVKLIISDTRMDVFIDDMDTPILHVRDLKLQPKAGALGFGTFLGAAYYANLTYKEVENPELVTKYSSSDIPTEKGTIMDWKVSKAFSGDVLKQSKSLKNLGISATQTLLAESSGILNLSRISPINDETNTVVAKFNIVSDSKQVKELHFGYSDKIIVFVNDRPVYSGDNSFRTRDYRYLGSIGYFDSIFLYLETGNNEIAFVVTEKRGGWGLKAKLSNDVGITLK